MEWQGKEEQSCRKSSELDTRTHGQIEDASINYGSRAVPADSADLGYDVLSQPQLRKLATMSLLLAVGL